MSEIAGFLALMAAKVASVGGFDHEEVLRDAGLNPKTIERERISWDQYIAVADRLYELAGSDEEAIRWGKHYADFAPRAVRALFAATMTPRRLQRMAVASLRQLYPPLLAEELEGTPDYYVSRITVREGYRDARSFFVFTIGTLIGSGRYLGLPDAPVDCDVNERSGRFKIFFQPQPSLSDRVRTFLSQLATPSGLQGPMLEVATGEELSLSPPKATETAATQWNLTTRQAQVLDSLVQGQSNKEIACALGCSTKTVEHHVTAILRAANCQTRAEVVAQVMDARLRQRRADHSN